jgi:hypothetical protein
MFEKASRLKLRFPVKGSSTVEDLWDLPLSALDQLYRGLNKELKDLQCDTLLEKQSDDVSILELKVDIIKHIVGVRVAEAKAKEDTLLKKEQARQLDEIIAKKENSALEGKTIDELKAMRASL